MLERMFLTVITMSFSASVAIAAVIVARLILKKAPKIFSYVLWGVVLFRLIVPGFIESPVSIVPAAEPLAEYYTLDETAASFNESMDMAVNNLSNQNSFIRIINYIVPTGEAGESFSLYVRPWEVWVPAGTAVWAAGITVMLIWSAVSYFKLRKRLRGALHMEDNIFLADHIESPFVMGLIFPKIYIPSSVSDWETEYIVEHERHHIMRRDHQLKALGFAALCLHWFNPLVWLAFLLASADMEMSCDEAVVKKLGHEIRADYSRSLLGFSTGKRIIAGIPLAFGEGSTEARIKNLAAWKKPALWITVTAAVLILAVTAMVGGTQKRVSTELMGADYSIKEVLYAVTVGGEISTPPPAKYSVTADYNLYVLDKEPADWIRLGSLDFYPLTNEELETYMPVESIRKEFRVAKITDAKILRTANQNFYIVFQTKNGKTYLGYGWEDVNERGQAGSDDTRLRRLYLLESNYSGQVFDSGFLDRSLRETIGKDIQSFSADWQRYKGVEYMIVNFGQDEGFGVFVLTDDRSGYKLLKARLFEDAEEGEGKEFFYSETGQKVMIE